MTITPQTIAGAMEFVGELRTRPPATQAYYDRAMDRIIVTLANDIEIGFPPRLVEELIDASPAELELVTLENEGRSLYWAKLGTVLSVFALSIGRFSPYSPKCPGLEAIETILQALDAERHD
jgi:hypothetical protein